MINQLFMYNIGHFKAHVRYPEGYLTYSDEEVTCLSEMGSEKTTVVLEKAGTCAFTLKSNDTIANKSCQNRQNHPASCSKWLFDRVASISILVVMDRSFAFIASQISE